MSDKILEYLHRVEWNKLQDKVYEDHGLYVILPEHLEKYVLFSSKDKVHLYTDIDNYSFVIVNECGWSADDLKTPIYYNVMFYGRMAGHEDLHLNGDFDDCFDHNTYQIAIDILKEFQYYKRVD